MQSAVVTVEVEVNVSDVLRGRIRISSFSRNYAAKHVTHMTVEAAYMYYRKALQEYNTSDMRSGFRDFFYRSINSRYSLLSRPEAEELLDTLIDLLELL